MQSFRINLEMDSFDVSSFILSLSSEYKVQRNHSFDWKNVKILNFEPNYNKRLISEIMHINEQKIWVKFKN